MDIRIVRLSVTMTRDPSIRTYLLHEENVRDALLYVGIGPERVARAIENFRFVDPMFLGAFLQVLYDENYLYSFLAELVRMGMTPDYDDEFHNHLTPLGIAYDSGEIRQVSAHGQAELELQSELKQLLQKADKRFPDMLDGAWQAFYSDSKDKYRQALVSCRELLADVLEALGDGETIKEAEENAEKPAGKRKMWVRKILGSGRESEIVTSSAELISSLYGMESSIHDEPERSRALFALTETEHILYFLLTHRLDKKKQR